MSVRTLNLTYSKSGGTLLPGYIYGVDRFGFRNAYRATDAWNRDGDLLQGGRIQDYALKCF